MKKRVVLAVVINVISILSLLYLTVRPDLPDADTYLQHGDQLMAINERRMAFRAYEQFLALEGDSPRAWNVLAKCYILLGEYDRALDALNTAFDDTCRITHNK